MNNCHIHGIPYEETRRGIWILKTSSKQYYLLIVKAFL